MYADGMMTSEEYLEHHGIKGQKWGIRRFQNPDGTLTAAGRNRLRRKPFESKREYEYRLDRNLNIRQHARKVSEKQRAADKEEWYEMAAEYDAEYNWVPPPNAKQKYLDAQASRKKALEEYTKAVEDAVGDMGLDKLPKSAQKTAKALLTKYSNELTKELQEAERADRLSRPNKTLKELKSVTYIDLQYDVNHFSGDWYEGKPMSTSFAQNRRRHDESRDEAQRLGDQFRRKYPDDYIDYERGRKKPPTKEDAEIVGKIDKLNKECRRLDYELCGVALRDLGYEDTPEARKVIDPIIFWD